MKNALIVLVALAFSFFALPTFAVELTIDGFMAAYSDATLSDYFIQFVVEKIADNPVLSLFLLGLSSVMPLIGFIANRTANPIDNALLILINKVLQTLSFNASKNQPDVLSWTEMLTNKPSQWPDILATNMMTKGNDLKDRAFKAIRIQ
jgi:hypothetical protein